MRYKRCQRWKSFCLNFIVIFMVSSMCITCKNEIKKEGAPTDLSSLSDEKLAKIMCGRCHLFPQPDLLDKSTWVDNVLPEMAYYVGIKPLTEKMFATNEKDFKGLLLSGYFPAQPLLLQKDWDRIVAYYKSNAPEALVVKKQVRLKAFDKCSYEVQYAPKGELPFISLATYQGDGLYVGDAKNNVLTIYNEKNGSKDTLQFSSPISDVVVNNTNQYILQIGMMNPNDRFLGKLTCIDSAHKKINVIDSLNRPVDLNMADLDNDGREDFIICNFGDKVGSLVCYDGRNFTPNTLAALPGARVTHIRDFDQNGLKDVMVLFSQGREKISIFYNQGKGHFEEVVLANFPSVYGSSYIDLADINGDGHEDVLYTAGDNADLSKITKPYHGLYILMYESQDKYTQQYFYPLNGASMVKSGDIDGDGDWDFVVTSYFPATTDQDRIILFENKKTIDNKLHFETWALDHTSKGNWLVCDVHPISKAMVFGCMSFPQTGNQGGVALIKIKPRLRKG